jgi:hypothetical protein
MHRHAMSQPSPVRIVLQLLAPLLATAMTAVILWAWFSLVSADDRPPEHAAFADLPPVSAWTDPYVPDPATLPQCRKPDLCIGLPEATWPRLSALRDGHFRDCEGLATRRLAPPAVHAYAQYRGLQVFGVPRNGMIGIAITWQGRRHGGPDTGWLPWEVAGDGGLYGSEPWARLWRTGADRWEVQVRDGWLPADFDCPETAP